MTADHGMLGKYQLLRRIAVGGMAEIFLARASAMHGFEKLVVVKRILPTHAENEDFIRMFLDEAKLAATLDHPNVVHVYDIGEHRGAYFFAMEYVHGEDVRSMWRAAQKRAKAIPLEHIINIAIGMTGGLHHAHEKIGFDGEPLGIVHRDVSPSNVIVTFEGAVKVVDFGIAKAATAQTATATGTLKGKIPYMSPEQCQGKPLDRRSDIFAIGIVLWELTLGRRLFKADSEFATLQRIVNEDAPLPSTINKRYPEALEHIVMKALQRDCELRYQTALEMQIDLEDFARDHRITISASRLAQFMGKLFPKESKFQPEREIGAAAAAERSGTRALPQDEYSDSGLNTDPDAHTRAEPSGTHSAVDPAPQAQPGGESSGFTGIAANPLIARPGAVLPSRDIRATGAPDGAGLHLIDECFVGPHGGTFRAQQGQSPLLVSVLSNSVMEHRPTREAVRRQLETSRHIKHTNVLPLLGYEQSGAGLLVARDLPRSTTLREFIAAHPHGVLDLRSAIIVACNLCDALAAIHPRFVHGFVTADTILIREDRVLLLAAAGEGIAVRRSPETDAFRRDGLLPTLPPDLFVPEPTPWADIYSVGALLYHMLTGRGLSSSSRATDLAHVPAPVRAVIDRAVSPNQHDRPPYAVTMRDELSRAFASLRPPPPPVPAVNPATPTLGIPQALPGGGAAPLPTSSAGLPLLPTPGSASASPDPALPPSAPAPVEPAAVETRAAPPRADGRPEPEPEPEPDPQPAAYDEYPETVAGVVPEATAEVPAEAPADVDSFEVDLSLPGGAAAPEPSSAGDVFDRLQAGGPTAGVERRPVPGEAQGPWKAPPDYERYIKPGLIVVGLIILAMIFL